MDMMTRIATLTAECLTSTWPEAAGLPTADEIRGLLAVPADAAADAYERAGYVSALEKAKATYGTLR